jgi:hypothetical protein
MKSVLLIELDNPRHKVGLTYNYLLSRDFAVTLVVSPKVKEFLPVDIPCLVLNRYPRVSLLLYLYFKKNNFDSIFFNTYRYSYQLLVPKKSIHGRLIDINVFNNRVFNYLSFKYAIHLPFLGGVISRMLILRASYLYHETYKGKLHGLNVSQELFTPLLEGGGAISHHLSFKRGAGHINLGIIGGTSKRVKETCSLIESIATNLSSQKLNFSFFFIGKKDFDWSALFPTLDLHFFNEELSAIEFENLVKKMTYLVGSLPELYKTPISTERYGYTKGSGIFFDSIKYCKPLLVEPNMVDRLRYLGVEALSIDKVCDDE